MTQRGEIENDRYRLVIPNREIKNLFIRQIREWFKESVINDSRKLDKLCEAFLKKDAGQIEELLGEYLWNTISIRDTAVSEPKKENFYHGILIGLLGYRGDWLIKSNAESGTGYSDILIEVPSKRIGIIIEVKYAENGNLDAACARAMHQIEEKQYTAKLQEDGMRTIIRYGIACYKKECRVMVEG